MTLPKYTCCILRVADDTLLFEQRPPSLRLAGGKLTCFGGRREDGEQPEDALFRELQEELQWAPSAVERAVDLFVGDELIAWFYTATLDVPITSLTTEPDRTAVELRIDELDEANVSPWHRAVLDAWRAGDDRVNL